MERKYLKAKKVIKDHELKTLELNDQIRTLKSKVLYTDICLNRNSLQKKRFF